MNHKNILFKNFKLNKKTINTKKILTELLKEDNKILQSLSTNYSDSYTKKSLSKYKNFKNIRIIGMGGSSLGPIGSTNQNQNRDYLVSEIAYKF